VLPCADIPQRGRITAQIASFILRADFLIPDARLPIALDVTSHTLVFYKHAYPAKPDKSKIKQGMIRRSAAREPGTKNAELMKKQARLLPARTNIERQPVS
jgi:hypothetical protein